MAENSSTFKVGDINVSPQHNTIARGDVSKRLQPKVMAVLSYLAKNSDRVIDNDELLEHVWEGRIVTHSSIQKSVNALRSAFSGLDEGREYVVYFSKRGYQLVVPVLAVEALDDKAELVVLGRSRRSPLFIVGIVMLAFMGTYSGYLLTPFLFPQSPSVDRPHVVQFTQLKPYGSDTGREWLVEPYIDGEKGAFIQDGFDDEGEGSSQSRLIMLPESGLQWQVSVARGQFVDLAWSPSGRNLVAVDAHSDDSVAYYTFHIYTLDYKGEKVIEKNVLSHWLGKVDSVSWLNERELEFVASQGGGENASHSENARYRYGIADQNLTKLSDLQGEGKLAASHLLNNSAAVLSLLDSGVQIQFFDESHQLIGVEVLPFNVMSMSWVQDGSGVLLVAEDSRLVILHKDGLLLDVDYSPKVSGRITRARLLKGGKSMVLTVEPEIGTNIQTSQFMKKGGGFIYTAR